MAWEAPALWLVVSMALVLHVVAREAMAPSWLAMAREVQALSLQVVAWVALAP